MRLLITICISLVLCASIALAEEVKKTGESKPETGRIAVIQTTKGTIKIALYEKDAPITTANFIGLADSYFYDGLTFHRVVPNFVIQGGDPKGDGTGGSKNRIKLEVSPKLKHDAAGVVAMARTSDPNSATSQFYITLAATPFLDGNYAVFGRVIEGLDVISKIEKGDKMETIRIYQPEQIAPPQNSQPVDGKDNKAADNPNDNKKPGATDDKKDNQDTKSNGTTTEQQGNAAKD